jgi:hypothetical protein
MDNDHYKKDFRRRMLAYRPISYPGRITLLVNEKTHRLNKDLGWKDIAEGGVAVYKVPGDHHTRLTSHRKGLAQLLLTCIDDALAEYAGQQNSPRADAA